MQFARGPRWPCRVGNGSGKPFPAGSSDPHPHDLQPRHARKRQWENAAGGNGDRSHPCHRRTVPGCTEGRQPGIPRHAAVHRGAPGRRVRWRFRVALPRPRADDGPVACLTLKGFRGTRRAGKPETWAPKTAPAVLNLPRLRLPATASADAGDRRSRPRSRQASCCAAGHGTLAAFRFSLLRCRIASACGGKFRHGAGSCARGLPEGNAAGACRMAAFPS